MDGGTGRCLCGAVRYAFSTPPNWQVHCHCESCRRATASAFTSFLGVPLASFHWTNAAPATYASSPGVTRSFCPACGTPMAYQTTDRAHEIDLYAATLDRPEAYRATAHVHYDEHLPWLHLADGLPTLYTPRRLTPRDAMTPVLSLIRESFAYMDGVIDPPSSMHRLTEADLARQAEEAEIWVLEDLGETVACVTLTPRADHLYIGKLAVAETHRGRGLSRQLVSHAEARAKALDLDTLELQSRVELTQNHAAFRAMGFGKTGESAHPGYDRATSLTFRKAV
ncbi:MAG: GNAT family N-acetyltransferase [Rhodobacteraceae bacterium]|nr:GNAT family N-acetyltransferase [Paracoccaceae bacterium]